VHTCRKWWWQAGLGDAGSTGGYGKMRRVLVRERGSREDNPRRASGRRDSQSLRGNRHQVFATPARGGGGRRAAELEVWRAVRLTGAQLHFELNILNGESDGT
jgi:hypothetical protein